LIATVEAVEKERNFYFGKLREIEILCQDEEVISDCSVQDLSSQVLAIMYKTDEGDEKDDDKADSKSVELSVESNDDTTF